MNLQEQYTKLYRYCYFRLGNVHLAEDITQETFLRYFGQNRNLEGSCQMAYLYTIARNLCIDYYRRKRTEPLKDDPEENPMEELIEQMDLKRAVDMLEDSLKEVIILKYGNELKAGEISKILGISRFQVYRREQEALKRIKAVIKEEEDGYVYK